MTQTVVVTTAFGGHEGTLTAFSNGLTNHGYHSPFHLFKHKKMARFMPHPAIYTFLCRHGYKQGETACQEKTSHLVRMAANKSCSKRGKIPAVTLLPVLSPHSLKPLACTLWF
jgi:hypothetical protein